MGHWVHAARAHRKRMGRIPLGHDELHALIKAMQGHVRAHLEALETRRLERGARNCRALPMAVA